MAGKVAAEVGVDTLNREKRLVVAIFLLEFFNLNAQKRARVPAFKCRFQFA